jgi:hypothetical protein
MGVWRRDVLRAHTIFTDGRPGVGGGGGGGVGEPYTATSRRVVIVGEERGDVYCVGHGENANNLFFFRQN